MQAAVMAHQKQLDNIHDHLEGEVEHLMVQGGCNDTCVSNMKDDGMLDDPSYVAYECKCASNWVAEPEVEEDIEEVPTELAAKAAAPAAAPVAKSDAIHLTTFTCACIIIFAIQSIMCFGCVYWCVNKNIKTNRSKVHK